MHHISIDFSTGSVTLDGNDIYAALDGTRPSPETKNWNLDLGEALLGNVVVNVFATRKPLLASISLAPPSTLDFWQKDSCAGKISAAIIAMGGIAWKQSNPSGYFTWGRVVLLSEWRDGGLGAHLSLVQSS